MSKISALTTSIVLLFTFATLTAANQLQKVTVRVDGLACPFCAYGLEKKLKKIESVDKLEIKINEGIVMLYFKEGAKIDKDVITKKVKEAGFTPRELQIEGESKKEIAAMKTHKISLDIKGISCEGCVSRIKNALNKLDCVHDVDVSLTAEKAEFTCADEKVDQKTFVQAIEALGFKAELSKK